jgi:hypothetical protein
MIMGYTHYWHQAAGIPADLFAEIARDAKVIVQNSPVPLDHRESGFEYVTARCKPRETEPTSWYWGHYFGDFDEAVADFRERAAKDVE